MIGKYTRDLLLELCACVTVGFVWCWIVARLVAPSTVTRLPSHGAVMYLWWIVLAIGGGALARYAESDLSESDLTRHNLVIQAGKVANVVGAIVGLGGAGRVILPLALHGIPRVQDSRLVWWFVLIAVAYTLFRFGGALASPSREDITSRFRTNFVGPSADRAMEQDPRPPIVYLRAFCAEQDKATYRGRVKKYQAAFRSPDGMYMFTVAPGRTPFSKRSFLTSLISAHRSIIDEQLVFAEVFGRIGPYIAVARPGETFRQMDIGAAKKHAQDDEWQLTVLRWLKQAAAVVVETADSNGLLWELRKVVEHVDPTQVLLVLPHDDATYESFRSTTMSVFPIPLPDWRAPSRLVTFSWNWDPVILDNSNMCLAESLIPFFQAADLEWSGMGIDPLIGS